MKNKTHLVYKSFKRIRGKILKRHLPESDRYTIASECGNPIGSEFAINWAMSDCEKCIANYLGIPVRRLGFKVK